jgi:hypothetical protein
LDLIVQDDAKDALIMLIISNRFIDSICHHVLEIVPQLSHVYLFDHVSHHQQFSSDQRFRGTFHDVQSLLEKIRDDIEEARQPRNVAGGIEYVLEESAQFFWYRFSFNVLGRLQHTEIVKRELISRLRDFYQHNSVESTRINNFENEYELDKAIWWSTRESFFYLSLNKALLENDINEIFLWRNYIQDLDKSLRKLRVEQRNLIQIFLYRGQALHINPLNNLKENLGKLVTRTPFLSTSKDRMTAEIFAGFDHSDPMLPSILYRINIDSNDTRAIFADIRELSVFYDEGECLFSLRSMFRIDRIEFINNMWYINVTAVDEDDQEFCTAINPWKATIGEQSFFLVVMNHFLLDI